MRSCSHKQAHQSQGPCNCQCIHRWPWPSCWPSPTTSVCLQPVPPTTQETAAGTHSQVRAYHQIWALLLPAVIPSTGPRDSAQQPFEPLWTMPPNTHTALAKEHAVAVDPNSLSQWNIIQHWTGATTHACTWWPAPLDLEWQNSPPQLPQVKIFPHWSQCLESDANAYEKLQVSWRTPEIWHHQSNTLNF